jgi:hypothetical protein
MYYLAEEHCPNHIPQNVSLRRGWILTERTTIYYCPPCEKEFWDELRIRDKKAAIDLADYVLWLGAHAQSKAPYDVTFKKGVWTVKCLLAGGRPASVEIGEDGREISARFPRNSSNQALQPTASPRE